MKIEKLIPGKQADFDPVVGIDIGSRAAKGVLLYRDEIYTQTLTTGMIMQDSADKLLKKLLEQAGLERKDLKYIIQKPVYVAPSMKISKLLKELQREQAHVAVVVDEYGGTAGIVTMEDILEELVGEIWDEHDEVVEDVSKIGDGEFLVQGTLTLEEFFGEFDITDDGSEADTVSGWVMEKLGKIPDEGESFEYDPYLITISKIVSRRITEVKLKKLEREEPSEEE